MCTTNITHERRSQTGGNQATSLFMCSVMCRCVLVHRVNKVSKLSKLNNVSVCACVCASGIMCVELSFNAHSSLLQRIPLIAISLDRKHQLKYKFYVLHQNM